MSAHFSDDYDLELERTASEILKDDSKRVLLQLPDGLKPKAAEIQEFLENKTKAQILIWGGSNFGACDIPIEARNLGVDLVVHYGHSQWVYDQLP
jgi:2-(3-amino-3-carboxypropyl)histidine synthase